VERDTTATGNISEDKNEKDHLQQQREQEQGLDQDQVGNDKNDKKKDQGGKKGGPSIPFHKVLEMGRSATVTDRAKTIPLPRPTGEIKKKLKDDNNDDDNEAPLPLPSPLPPSRKNSQNKKDKSFSAVSDLEQWVEEMTDSQCQALEQHLRTAMERVLTGQEIQSSYEDILDNWQEQEWMDRQPSFLSQDGMDVENEQQQQQQQQQPEPEPEQPEQPQYLLKLHRLDQKKNYPKSVARFSILSSVLDTILPPFVSSMRKDIRNIIIWFLSGALAPKINGAVIHMNPALEAAAAGEDQETTIFHRTTTTTTSVGTNDNDGDFSIVETLKDIFDPKMATLVLDCVKAHFHMATQALVDLFWTRIGDAKEFLINQILGLIGLPAITSSGGGTSVLVSLLTGGQGQVGRMEVDEKEENSEITMNETVASSSSGPLTKYSLQSGGKNVQRTGEFVGWIVDSVLAEFEKTASSMAGSDSDYASAPDAAAADNIMTLKASVSKMESNEEDDTIDNKGQPDSGTNGAGSRITGTSPFDGICSWMGDRVEAAQHMKRKKSL
ncbi:hypothetical protein BG004_005202, partial [Podila humilis]